MEHQPIQTTFLTAALCLVSGMAPSLLGAAEEASAEVTNLAPYVVVATRTPLGLDRISPSVDYISQEDMEFWQDQDLVDVLNRQTGMTLATSGGIGAQTSLFTRGTESNHTAFFMDGRRLNTGFGNQYDLEFLSIGNLSSVQIQRGASSVNYGSSGIGGVVELRTQSALDLGNTGGLVEAEFGSNNYRRGAVETTVVAGDFGFSLSGSVLSTDNERDSDDYEAKNATTRFDYRLTDQWSLELIGKYSDADKELPGSVVAPKLEDRQNTENWLISPGLRYASDELSVHAFYSRSETRTTLNQMRSSYDAFWTYRGDFLANNEIEMVSDEFSLQADYSLSDDVLLTTGFVFRSDDASNSNLEFDPLEPVNSFDEEFEQLGGYAQILWLIGDFELRGGLRYDDYSDFDSETTGSAEVIYHIDQFNAAVFAKYATSYAPPGASDIAFDYSSFGTPLDAEQSRSYELGFRQKLLDGDLEWAVVAFRNDIDDMLGYEAIEVAPFTYEYDTINVKSAMTEGLEVTLAYAATDQLNLSAGYTYLTALDEDTDTRLVRRPRHMLQLGADYSFTDTLNAGIQATGYFDREDIDALTYAQGDADDFVVVRLVADWAVCENVTLFARVENLLDKEYELAAGYPALGRAGYIGARFEF
ncbi:TonB-dependent receptor [Coraliomargarita sp. W4R53]